MTQNISTEALALLGCPKCRATPLAFRDGAVACPKCDWTGGVVGKVVDAMGDNDADFDSLYETMQENNSTNVITEIMYVRQSAVVESLTKPGMVVLDIGCGPNVPYKKQPGSFLIGLDPSVPSVVRNVDLDLGLGASATELPLRDRSVDLIVCFYSIHHMVGDYVPETVANVNAAFSEFARVLKPGGTLLIFEVCPWLPFALLQRVLWRSARRFIGKAINYYFWRRDGLKSVAARHLGNGAAVVEVYRCSPWAVFPPIFTLQWLRVPRFVYPFNVTSIRWQKPAEVALT